MTKLDSPDLLRTSQELHWASSYIGLPWVNGGQGPDEFDCWGFFRFIQLRHFSIEVPAYDIDANDFRRVATKIMGSDERTKWESVSLPKNGCAVLMAHSKYPSHVGIWLDVDGGGVLHCVRGEGVVFSASSSLKNSGWGRVEYYKYVSNT
jgi:cell wall-associated NlpC family hydrolase